MEMLYMGLGILAICAGVALILFVVFLATKEGGER